MATHDDAARVNVVRDGDIDEKPMILTQIQARHLRYILREPWDLGSIPAADRATLHDWLDACMRCAVRARRRQKLGPLGRRSKCAIYAQLGEALFARMDRVETIDGEVAMPILDYLTLATRRRTLVRICWGGPTGWDERTAKRRAAGPRS